MLDLENITKQVARLGGLNNAPVTPEGWTELSKVLQRRCLTMDHVERVLDRWLETEENVPKPVQLAALCGEVPADSAMDRPILAEPCEECAPEGLWGYVERVDSNGETVLCHARCSCTRGRQLAAMDARRAALEATRSRKQPGRLSRIDDEQQETGS